VTFFLNGKNQKKRNFCSTNSTFSKISSSGDLSHEAFSPAWFLLENHHGTSFEDLKAGLSYLRRKVESQKEGQLSFLKSNAGSVIDQLDTLMMLRDKFQQDVGQGKQDQLVKLEQAIQSEFETKNIFLPF
jgi:exocyst complex component 2